MNCPKCDHPDAECVIGNYWECPGCADQEKLRGLINKLAQNPIPVIHRSFKSDDPMDMNMELFEAVREFEACNNYSPSFVTVSVETYEKISGAVGHRLAAIRTTKIKPILFVANGVYVVS